MGGKCLQHVTDGLRLMRSVIFWWKSTASVVLEKKKSSRSQIPRSCLIPLLLKMLRPKASPCLFCSFRIARATTQWPIQQTASMRTMQVARPSRSSSRPNRMSLAEPRRVNNSESKKPEQRNRRKQDGPFGGMNLKEAGIRGAPPRTSTEKPPNKTVEYKALKMQRALAPMSYGGRAQLKEAIADITFDSFPLIPSVQIAIPTQALKGMEDLTPTPVQKIAIPALLGEIVGRGGEKLSARARKSKEAQKKPREDFLLAAETGSGKTLAYLLPTINAIKLAEATDEEAIEYEAALKEEQRRNLEADFEHPPLSTMPHPTTGRPRAIILVPTTELVNQVGALVKSLSHVVKFRSAMISSSYSGKVIRNRLFSDKGIDVVIATPHLFQSIAEKDPNIYSRVTHLIIDEADSLMDRGFSPITTEIIDRCTPSLKQLILCSATIPRSLDNFLRTRFPDIRRLTTPNLHAIPRRVQLGVIDIDGHLYQGNRNLACADTIWNIGKAAAEHDGPVKGQMDVKRILVFVNERETTSEVADFLCSKGIDAISLNRDTEEARKTEMLASFTLADPLTIPKDEQHPGGLRDNLPNYIPAGQAPPPVKRSLPNVKVVVTTDLGSRGIDTLAVRHVILYDVPHSTIDFIHRLGRTGRMGRRGRGIVLVGKNDRKDVVAEIKSAMFSGKALI